MTTPTTPCQACAERDANIAEMVQDMMKDGEHIAALTRDKEHENQAAAELCEIYFNIAADIIGEEQVRNRRDKVIADRRGEG